MNDFALLADASAAAIACDIHPIADLLRLGDRSVMCDIAVEPPEPYRVPAGITDERQAEAASAELHAQFVAPREVTPPGRSIAYLRDCTVLPNAAIVTADGHVIRESCLPYTDRWISKFFAPWISGEGAARRAMLEPYDAVDAPGVHVREHGEMGFFHWMHSVLPRAELFSRHGLSHEFALACAAQLDFQRDSLALAGLDTRRRIAPVAGRCQAFRELMFPSAPVAEGDFWLRPPSVAAFYDALEVPRLNGPSRLYVTRKDAAVRRLRNEEAALDQLRRLGFVSVELEAWSFAAQLALFRGAEAVVGVHGAGLSHLIGMAPGTVAMEILHPRRFWPTYRAIAARRGLIYGFLVGEDDDASVTGDSFDFSVDVARLCGVLARLGVT